MIRVDMHFHSTCSDGTDSPEALVRLGKKRGLVVMSLTDHDTMTGVPVFLSMCKRYGIRGVSGVEISAEYPTTLHILGYNYKVESAEFQSALQRIQAYRQERNYKMLEKLNRLGVNLSMDEVQKEAGKGVIGRPHFAYALIRKGIVHDIPTAFSEFLGRGGRAYVHKVSLSPEETISEIRKAGGLPVLAHPIQTCSDMNELTKILRWLKSQGLWGLECYSGHHNPEQTAYFRDIAIANGLEITAGSDYHGRGRPGYHFGVSVPENLLPWARLGIIM